MTVPDQAQTRTAGAHGPSSHAANVHKIHNHHTAISYRRVCKKIGNTTIRQIYGRNGKQLNLFASTCSTLDSSFGLGTDIASSLLCITSQLRHRSQYIVFARKISQHYLSCLVLDLRGALRCILLCTRDKRSGLIHVLRGCGTCAVKCTGSMILLFLGLKREVVVRLQ